MKKLSLLALILLISGCSEINYLLTAGLNQVQILRSRENISEITKDSDRPTQFVNKLKLVQDSLKFAKHMGLNVGQTYSSFAEIKNEKKVWVLMACKENSFRLHYWNYPIVGKTPYKGFFIKSDALAEENKFLKNKFTTEIRTALAFSTLGWFDDPLMPSMLKSSPVELTNTIFHELVHKDIWIQNHVAINESLANLVGHRLNVLFYRERLKELVYSTSSTQTLAKARQQYRMALLQEQKLFKGAARLRLLYQRIKLAQQQKMLTAEKRSQIFRRLKINSEINNAAIMQRKIYLTAIPQLNKCYQRYPKLPELFAFIDRMIKLHPKHRLKALKRCESRN
jgi:predicted aminopeptidase